MRHVVPRSEFVRHVLTLMTGTSLAQVLPILASPLLTRLYTPVEFGLLGLFIALTSVLSIPASARYEIAILLPADDDDALNIMALALCLSMASSMVLVVLAIALNGPVTRLLHSPAISRWLYLVPVFVLLTGMYQSVNYWFNRKKNYKLLAANRVARSVLTVIATIALGLDRSWSGGLILGTVIGQGLATIGFVSRAFVENPNWRQVVSRKRMLAMGARYKDFARFSVPADTVNTATQQLPAMILAPFFSTATVGQFNLTQRVLAAPSGLVAVAIGDVFRQRASEDMNREGNCRAIFVKTMKTLASLAVAPFAIIALFAPALFTTIFGPDWNIAGHFAQVLAPCYGLGFVASILGRTIYVTERVKEDLIWQMVLFALALGALLTGSRLHSAPLAVGLFSAVYSCMYVIYLVMSYRFSHGRKQPAAGPDGAAEV